MISNFSVVVSMALVVLLTCGNDTSSSSSTTATALRSRPPADNSSSSSATTVTAAVETPTTLVSEPRNGGATTTTTSKSTSSSSETTAAAASVPPTALSKWASSLQQAPLGAMGPEGTRRANYRYYDSLYYLALQYGADATSLLEVGCANDPFANYLDWIDERACVAPYFIHYESGKDTETKKDAAAVQSFKADFMVWQEPHLYDIVLCGQVLEHVPHPRSFLQKLIHTAKQATIVSVPYQWEDCGTNCGHRHHWIDEKTIAEWAAPHKPVYHGVVRERNGVARIIAVFAAPHKNQVLTDSLEDQEDTDKSEEK